MQKIVFVTRSLGNSGTEKALMDLIERMDPSVCEVVILTMALDPYSDRLSRRKDLRVRISDGPRTESFLASWRTFRSLKPDVVVFVNAQFGQTHWQVYLAARLSGARRVVAIEQLIAPPRDVREAARFVDRLADSLRRRVTTPLPGFVCHTTICVSDAVRNRVVRDYGYPEKKTVTIPNSVDVKYFARGAAIWNTPPILADAGRGPVAVCISLLVPVKRLDLLIQAMKKVTARFPQSRCVILGDGLLEGELRALVRELGLERNVLLAGRTNDVRPYLAAADLFVLSSEREGLPLSMLEAMAFGLPCVATDAGGNREVLRDGVNGLLVGIGSHEVLADAIGRLFADPEERARMGANARRIVEEEFEIEKCMARMTAVILGNGSDDRRRTSSTESAPSHM